MRGRIGRKIEDYKMRHLKIGKVKNLDKDNPYLFCIEKISWDVHWQTGLYLAVIIRDYLRAFIKETPAIGNCVFENTDEFKYGMTDEQNKYYAKKWEDMVNAVADEFDEVVQMILVDDSEIDDHIEFNKKEKALQKKAFSDLAEIFDELWW